ncbi:MAG: GNAT family N-acetyltransferase [Kineosporiaceae bacterium]
MTWPVPPGTELRGGHGVGVRAADPETDAAGLHAALDHEAVWRHVAGRPRSVAEWTALLAARTTDPLWHTWVVRAGERVVGMSSYLEVSPADARLEIGFTAYAPDVWGTAVNPECKLLLLGHAFEGLGCGRVQLKTDIRNVRSQRAIHRLGARHEGVLRRYQRRADGTVRDTVLFSVVAEEWPAVRAGLRARLDR